MYQTKRYQNSIVIVCLSLLMFLSACATTGTGNVMSTKQQGLVMHALYKTTFLEVKATRENPKATLTQIALANKKEAVLQQVFPVLTDFMTPVDPKNPAGDIVGYGLSEQKITLLFGLIDQLSQLAITGGTV